MKTSGGSGFCCDNTDENAPLRAMAENDNPKHIGIIIVPIIWSSSSLIRLFEFLANPINFNEKMGGNTEWSLTMTGLKGDLGLNFLTTSHNNEREEGITDLMENQLLHGYTIREHRHNHPSNQGFPSGLDDRDKDIGFADWITTKSKQKVVFKIYTANNCNYVKYKKDSQPDAFSTYSTPKIVLPEIIVTPKK